MVNRDCARLCRGGQGGIYALARLVARKQVANFGPGSGRRRLQRLENRVAVGIAETFANSAMIDFWLKVGVDYYAESADRLVELADISERFLDEDFGELSKPSWICRSRASPSRSVRPGREAVIQIL